MKATNIFAFLAAFSLCVVAFRPCLAAEGDLIDVRPTQDAPVKLIFDTDIGGDIDDAFALRLIHSLCNRGVVELLAVTITNPDENAGRFVAACDAINGRPEIPVGLLKEGDFDSDFYPSATLAQKTDDGSLEYPVPEGYRPEDPVKLLRKTLANAQDGEIVIAQVGSSTNLAALLDSDGDEISPLSGKELAAKKVRLVSVMGGAFAIDSTAENYRNHREWNIRCDIPAAQKFAAEWPGEIIFTGYEVGDRIRMSPVNLKRDYRSPRAKFLRDAFVHWAEKNAPTEGLNHERPTWDLTAVFFVARPEEGRGYFEVSEPGNVAFDDEGTTVFTPDPNGKRRAYLVDEAARVRVKEAMINLCSEP